VNAYLVYTYHIRIISFIAYDTMYLSYRLTHIVSCKARSLSRRQGLTHIISSKVRRKYHITSGKVHSLSQQQGLTALRREFGLDAMSGSYSRPALRLRKSICVEPPPPPRPIWGGTGAGALDYCAGVGRNCLVRPVGIGLAKGNAWTADGRSFS
jgi:hypothetical protein